MQLSDVEYGILEKRGHRYCRVLTVYWEDIPEVLGRAFVKLVTFVNKVPLEDQWRAAENFWRQAVYQAVIQDYDQRKRFQRGMETEVVWNPSNSYDNEDFVHKTLHSMFEYLSDDDIIRLLALVDCEFGMSATAEYLGVQRTNMYQILRRIQAKIIPHFPELRKRVSVAKFSQEYIDKEAVDDSGKWCKLLPGIEVVGFLNHPSGFYNKHDGWA